MLYYLDIETYSQRAPDPAKDKIISIQFQPLCWEGAAGRLIILKEWESNEREIVKKFYRFLTSKGVWGFVPVGFSLTYEFAFLNAKFEKYLKSRIDFFGRPHIDLKHIIVMMNGGFKGAKLSHFSTKRANGNIIPLYYKKREYRKIEEYVKEEARAFSSLFSALGKMLKSIKPRFYRPLIRSGEGN